MLARTNVELVEAALGGDVGSFGELYRRHYRAVVGVAYCIVSDRHLAEDAAQETFAIACRDLVRLRRAEKFPSWVAGICRKVARRSAKTHLHQRIPDNLNMAEEVAEENDDRSIVRQAVDRLTGSSKEVIVLQYFSGLSHKQISEMLNISTQAVHGRLIRARRKLANDLSQKGFSRSDL